MILQHLNAWFELKKKEYFSITQGSLFKLTKTEYEFIIDLIHRENSVLTDEKNEDEYSKENFLDQVYMTEAKYDRLVAALTRKKISFYKEHLVLERLMQLSVWLIQ